MPTIRWAGAMRRAARASLPLHILCSAFVISELSKAFQIGLCQVLALIPGTSRSGATILGGELLGVDRVAATKFTFYLAVPTMMGATVFELYKKGASLSHGQGLNIAVGFVVSFLVAYVVIRQFLVIVARYGLTPFGWYRIVAGLALAAYLWV